MELNEAMERIRKLEPPVEREAIKCIREHKEDAIPLLLERLRNALQQALTDYEEGEDETEWDYFYPMYLLAEFRVHDAFEPLAALLEYDEDITDWFLGESITEDFACVLASCAQPEDFARLRELAADNGLRERLWSRLAALEAACILYGEGDGAHEDLLALMRETLAQAVAENDGELAAFTAIDAVEVGLFELNDEIRLLFDQGKMDHDVAGDWEMFARHSRLEQSPTSALRKFRRDIYHRKIDNAIAIIESWPNFKPSTTAVLNVLAVPQAAEEQRRPSASKKAYPNDPCPCGSGKKYKKCCMEY